MIRVGQQIAATTLCCWLGKAWLGSVVLRSHALLLIGLSKIMRNREADWRRNVRGQAQLLRALHVESESVFAQALQNIVKEGGTSSMGFGWSVGCSSSSPPSHPGNAPEGALLGTVLLSSTWCFRGAASHLGTSSKQLPQNNYASSPRGVP